MDSQNVGMAALALYLYMELDTKKRKEIGLEFG